MKSIQFPRPGNSGAWNRYDLPPVYTSTGDLHLSWDVPYEPGVLKAVGRKGGKSVVSEEIRTTGRASAIRLSPDRSIITAGNKDVAQLVVEIVDENGNMVPTAADEVRLTLEGEGKLIGFDNGNPWDHTNMKSPVRKAFNGLALAIIQSGSKPGTIKIKAESPGLRGSEVMITAVR
jgi:beta-galactosidase